MKKFTDGGRRAWRPIARGKRGGYRERSARLTGEEKLGQKTAFHAHREDEATLRRSMAQRWWRAAETCWKAARVRTVRILSSSISYLVLFCKAVAAWLYQNAWKPLSCLLPSAQRANTGQTSERSTVQKDVAPCISRQEPGTPLPEVEKRVSNASKGKTSKQKKEKLRKKTGDAKPCLEHSTGASVSGNVQSAVLSINTSQEDQQGEPHTFSRRRQKPSPGSPSNASQDTPNEDSNTRKELCVTVRAPCTAPTAAPAEQESVHLFGTAVITTEATEQVGCSVSQNESASFQVHERSTAAIPAPANAADNAAVTCSPEVGNKGPASASAATLPAALEYKLHTPNTSENSSPMWGRSRDALRNEEDDGFTLATSRSGKPTVRQPAGDIYYFRKERRGGTECAVKHGETTLPQRSGNKTVPQLNTSSHCPPAMSPTSQAGPASDVTEVRSNTGNKTVPQLNTSSHCPPAMSPTSQAGPASDFREVRSNTGTRECPSKFVESQIVPTQKEKVRRAGRGAEQRRPAGIQGVVEEEQRKVIERAPLKVCPSAGIEGTGPLKDGPASLPKRQATSTCASYSQRDKTSSQRKGDTFTKNAPSSLDVKEKPRVVSWKKAQLNTGREPRKAAGGTAPVVVVDKIRQTSARQDSGEAEHSCTTSAEVQASPPGERLAGTATQGVESETAAKEDKHDRNHLEPEQPKRWGDCLSDEEDDVCSWGSRDSGGKQTPCMSPNRGPTGPANQGRRSPRPVSTPLATRLATTKKTPPHIKKGGIRTEGSLPVSTGNVGFSTRHEGFGGGRSTNCFNQEHDPYENSGNGQGVTQCATRSHLSKGPGALTSRASRMCRQEFSEPLPRATKEGATFWPSLSSAAHVKAGRSAPYSNRVPYDRRLQARQVKWCAAPGEETERRHAYSSRNAGTRAAVAKSQAGSMWRVRDQPRPAGRTNGSSCSKSTPTAGNTRRPSRSASSQDTIEFTSQTEKVASPSGEPAKDDKQTSTTSQPPGHEQRVTFSETCHVPRHSSTAGAPFSESYAQEPPEEFIVSQVRARRRRPRCQQRRGGHCAVDGYHIGVYHAQGQPQQQTNIYPYQLPPPPPPPPPSALGLYSAPHTYPGISAHSHEEYTSPHVPPEIISRGLLLPHPDEQQLHQLVAPLHAFNDPGACFLPVAYSTPAALYEAQQQLECPCTWVYSSAAAMAPQSSSKQVEPSEEHHNATPANSYLGIENGGQNQNDVSTDRQTPRGHMYPLAETTVREASGHEMWQREYISPRIYGLSNEGKPQEPRRDQQQKQQGGDRQQQQQQPQGEEQIRCGKEEEKGKCEHNGGGNKADKRQPRSQNDSRVKETRKAIEELCNGNHAEVESCSRKDSLDADESTERAVTEADASPCHEISDRITLQMQKSARIPQIPAEASTVVVMYEEHLVDTPGKGAVSAVHHTPAAEEEKKAALDHCSTNRAGIVAYSPAPEESLDNTATTVCSATKEHEKAKEGRCEHLHSHSDTEKMQQETCLTLVRTARCPKCTAAETLNIPVSSPRQHTESTCRHKAADIRVMNGCMVAQGEVYLKTVLASDSANPEGKHLVEEQDDRIGCTFGSAAAEKEEDRLIHLHLQSTVSQEKRGSAVFDDTIPLNVPVTGEGLSHDTIRGKESPQREENRASLLNEGEALLQQKKQENCLPIKMVPQSSAKAESESGIYIDTLITQHRADEKNVYACHSSQESLLRSPRATLTPSETLQHRETEEKGSENQSETLSDESGNAPKHEGHLINERPALQEAHEEEKAAQGWKNVRHNGRERNGSGTAGDTQDATTRASQKISKLAQPKAHQGAKKEKSKEDKCEHAFIQRCSICHTTVACMLPGAERRGRRSVSLSTRSAAEVGNQTGWPGGSFFPQACGKTGAARNSRDGDSMNCCTKGPPAGA